MGGRCNWRNCGEGQWASLISGFRKGFREGSGELIHWGKESQNRLGGGLLMGLGLPSGHAAAISEFC